MNAILRSPEHHYTLADYLAWPEGERWELIGGVAYGMAPAPSVRHQQIVLNFAFFLKERLKGKTCRPFVAPMDVVLSDHDVVQPDISVVCDPVKITDQNIRGAPDLVIEVLSPATSTRDLREKKALYQGAGVPEYLVVDPLELYVQRFVTGEGGRYGEGEIFGAREELPLFSLAGCVVPLWEIFELEPPAEGSANPS
jgi:Uma2 family endonuclease